MPSAPRSSERDDVSGEADVDPADCTRQPSRVTQGSSLQLLELAGELALLLDQRAGSVDAAASTG